MRIQVRVFKVVTSCSAVAGYQRYGGPCCLHLHGEDEDIMDNTTRRHKFRRPRFESSPPW